MSKFDSLKELSKCCMADYCIYSVEDKYCIADDETVSKCPYLQAIDKIAALSMDSIISYED